MSHLLNKDDDELGGTLSGTFSALGQSISIGDHKIRITHATDYAIDSMQARFGKDIPCGSAFTDLPTRQNAAQIRGEYLKGVESKSPVVFFIRMMQANGQFSDNVTRHVGGPYLKPKASTSAKGGAANDCDACLYVSGVWLDIPNTEKLAGISLSLSTDIEITIVPDGDLFYIHYSGARVARLEMVIGLIPHLVHSHRKLFLDAKQGTDNLRCEIERLRGENERLTRAAGQQGDNSGSADLQRELAGAAVQPACGSGSMGRRGSFATLCVPQHEERTGAAGGPPWRPERCRTHEKRFGANAAGDCADEERQCTGTSVSNRADDVGDACGGWMAGQGRHGVACSSRPADQPGPGEPTRAVEPA